MDNSLPVGGTFSLLNTQMTIESKNYSYYLQSQNENVYVIFAQGQSSYERNDVYGQFTASYTWNAYFDPSTGYIVGYTYNEHDINPSGTGFTYTENLYVESTSYPLTVAAPGSPTGTPTPMASSPSGGLPNPIQYAPLIVIGVFALIVIISILAYSLARRKALPKHSYQQPYQPQPPRGTPPDNIDLTPKQPTVQQIVIKEVVKVNCRYCGALIDSTAETCPICGAPRT
jgi:hypothetical protein